MHIAPVCNVHYIRMQCAHPSNNKFSVNKMKRKNILTKLMELEEYTKYFDLLYWKERRQNPNSPDLNNWTARKRRRFQQKWIGEKNGRYS